MSGGKTLYSSEMLEALSEKVDLLMDKFDAQTEALGNINGGVAQSVSILNVVGSDVSRYALPTDVTLTCTTDAYTQFFKARMSCKGVIKVKVKIRIIATGTSNTFTWAYSKDGGTTKTALTGSVVSINGTKEQELSDVLSVEDGDILQLYCKAPHVPTGLTGAEALINDCVCYDLADIVNDGALAVLA